MTDSIAAARNAKTAADVSEFPVLIEPREPLIFRDARPFDTDPGARAFSLPWPWPRTVSGAVRTHVVNQTMFSSEGWNNRATASQARHMRVHGPLLAAKQPGHRQWTAHVPAPLDLVTFRKVIDGQTETADDRLSFMALRPGDVETSACCDLPVPENQHARERVKLRPLAVTEDVKPESGLPAWWSIDDAVKWLTTVPTDPETVRSALPITVHEGREYLRGIGGLPTESRFHVSIHPETQTNREGALFVTEARAFRDDLGRSSQRAHEPATALLCNVFHSKTWNGSPAYVRLGGEGRLSSIRIDRDHASWPAPVVPTEEQLASAHGLRLLLVTPAIFTHGWLPGWMAEGVPPGLGGTRLQLTLVGAAMGRRIPVSGWRLAHREKDGIIQPPGPRATVYAVPAGSVLFFETSGPITAEHWQKLWLKPISDLGVHRDEGFGLVLPGLW